MPHRLRTVLVMLIASLAPAAVALAGLQARVNQLVSAADLKGTQVGLMVLDVDTGEELAKIDPDEPMKPASNMKLVTSAAALKLLGPDFAFRTELQLVKTSAGPCLWVKGDGDPAFGDQKVLEAAGLDLEQLLQLWVKAVVDAGIKEVPRLVVDDRVFDGQFVHPTWSANQLSGWDHAQVTGLTINDNCVDVYAQPSKPGQSPRVQLFPASSAMTLVNKAVTGNSDTFSVDRKAGVNQIICWGTLRNPLRDPKPVTIHDPPIFLGQVLADRLAKAGVRVGAVTRPALEENPPVTRVLHRVVTPISIVLQRCNKDSQNLFAECLLKRTGYKVTGAAGGWDNGAAAVRMFLRDQLGPRGGPRTAVVQLVDGSGLSHDNRVTARVLCELMRAMHQDAAMGPIFLNSLSMAGRDGTLRLRMSKGLTGQVYGKTGSINGVIAASGYLITPRPATASDGDAAGSRRTLAFSFLFNYRPPVNGQQLRRLQDELIRMIDAEIAPQPERVRMGG